MSERKSGFGPSLIVVLAVMFAVFISWAAWMIWVRALVMTEPWARTV